MEENEEKTELIEAYPEDDSWKWKTVLTGGILGALVGVGAALLLTRRAEQKGQKLAITSAKGVQLGVLLTGLLRSILSIGED